jgi:tetratricopeptide (TPR) repeat protein
MANDPYAPCPCGSGQKFKWCCQPIAAAIARAFDQDEAGQHDAALRTLDEVIAENPTNPEPLGRKAQLLFKLDRVDEAEDALQKAFAINPDYPFGHLLRGSFLQSEGEAIGALQLFRRAAELYHPEARDVLAQVYASIADSELKLNRPLAARAALQMAVKDDPANEMFRQWLEETFGDKGRLPAVARQEYTFQSLPNDAFLERKAAWQRALSSAATGKLTGAARAFEQLTEQDAGDAAAWYNLGLLRAWLGANGPAVDAMDRYVALEPDEKKAADAWALAEVLFCGEGMEERTDYSEYSVFARIASHEHLATLFNQLQQERLLMGLQVSQEEGVVTGVLLQRPQALTAEQLATQPRRLAGFVMLIGQILRLWSVNGEAVREAFAELQKRAGPALADPQWRQGPAQFHDVLSEVIVYPLSATSQEEAEQKVRQYAERFFEEAWIQRRLHALQGNTPLDAAGHPVLRKKLLGVIAFLQSCAAMTTYPYDFDRLRHKLNLTAPAPAATGQPAARAIDFGSMNVAELAALKDQPLTDEQLEQAYQAARKLDAKEVTRHFLGQLLAKPAQADRYPLYSQLIQMDSEERDWDAALDHVNAGEKDDCEHNEGRRRNDYELRRGQVQVKRGDVDAAQEVFDRLIARAPDQLKYRGSAAEAMLSAKQPARAAKFAAEGLAQARKQNDRDSEQYFLELAEAARKQGG